MKKILLAFLLLGALLFGCTNTQSQTDSQTSAGQAAIDSGQASTGDVPAADAVDGELDVQPAQDPAADISDVNDSALDIS